MPTKIIGNAPYQVPRNTDLGSLAYQDAKGVNVTGGAIALNANSSSGYFVDTDVSEVKPSLNLDFAQGKVLDSRIAFSRNTGARYYDGTVFKAEENLWTYSNFTNTSSEWTTANTYLAPASTLAPDGTMTGASLISATASSASKGIRRSYPDAVSGVATSEFTVSLYAKAGSHSFIQVASNLSGWGQFNVNLSTGATGAIGTASGSATAVGNGWYRIVVNTTYGYTGGGSVYLYLVDSTASTEGAATTSTGNIYVWGLQIERRAGASGYTATTNAGITNFVPALKTSYYNAPRFDHNPYTGESKGLLIEESRTNLLTYSEDFSAWQNDNGPVIQNSTVAPDGNITADKLCWSTTGNNHSRSRTFTTANGTSYTFSVYAKAAELRYLDLSVYYNMVGGYPEAIFDLVSGTITMVANASTSNATMTPVGNGWYRCSISMTANSVGTSYTYISVTTASNNLNCTQTTNDSIGVYVWGGQLEAGLFATSYIQTTSSTVTRSADVAKIDGTAFSSWYNQSEGTVYAEASHIMNTASDKRILEIENLAGDLRQFDLRSNNGNINCIQLGAGITADTYIYGIVSSDTFYKVAVAKGVPNTMIAANGILGNSAPVSRMHSNADSAFIGSHQGVSYFLNGWLKKLTYFPKRLSNAELQEITL